MRQHTVFRMAHLFMVALVVCVHQPVLMICSPMLLSVQPWMDSDLI